MAGWPLCSWSAAGGESGVVLWRNVLNFTGVSYGEVGLGVPEGPVAHQIDERLLIPAPAAVQRRRARELRRADRFLQCRGLRTAKERHRLSYEGSVNTRIGGVFGTKAVETQGKGSVLATKAVETQGKAPS